VHGPHLPGPEAEALGSGDQQSGPRRFSRTQAPCRIGARCGERSRPQRPAKSSTSTACAGTGINALSWSSV